MLVNTRIRRPRGDDDGAVLITVLVVMLVGFIVASTVAASVIFTVTRNDATRNDTQAFVAAESGRDVAVAALARGCASTTFSGTTPRYESAIFVTTGDRPDAATDPGVTAGCPTRDSRYVVIRSTGTAPDGSTTTIDSVYPWQVFPSETPGGVVTYFSGSFNAGVSRYTGDLVLRQGDWSCNIGGVLDGDLYVLEGTVELSNNCTINGNVWASGDVTSSSQAVTIRGNITTNGAVRISANGGALIEGSITAKGPITLTDEGSTPARVTGSLTSRGAITVGSKWTVDGTRTPSHTSDPVFTPTLSWLGAATRWIDLDNTGWGAAYAATDPCRLVSNNPSPTIASLLSTAGDPLVLDFTSCGNGAVTISLNGATVRRDAVFIAKPSVRMVVSVSGTISEAGGPHQMVFVHSDASRNFSGGEPVPHCGNGSQNDKFDVSGSIDPDVHIMIYSPCGLTGTTTSSFSGQYYTNDVTHMHSSATYTCEPMAWSTAFEQLGCRITGDGGLVESSVIQRLGELVYQSED